MPTLLGLTGTEATPPLPELTDTENTPPTPRLTGKEAPPPSPGQTDKPHLFLQDWVLHQDWWVHRPHLLSMGLTSSKAMPPSLGPKCHFLPWYSQWLLCHCQAFSRETECYRSHSSVTDTDFCRCHTFISVTARYRGHTSFSGMHRQRKHNTNHLCMTLNRTNWANVISVFNINKCLYMCVDRKQAPLWFDMYSRLALCSETVPTSHHTSICSTSILCLASCPLAHTATSLKASVCPNLICLVLITQIQQPSLGVPFTELLPQLIDSERCNIIGSQRRAANTQSWHVICGIYEELISYSLDIFEN